MLQASALVWLALVPVISGFTVSSIPGRAAPTKLVPRRTEPLQGFNDEYGWGQDVVRRKEREQRAAEAGDRVVEVAKPLGAILEEDNNGDVFVASVMPGSNAERAGLKPGELISMVSATFGNELWSAKGAGLGRVTKAIKVRIGNSVQLVVQNEKEAAKRARAAQMSAGEKKRREEEQMAKRDKLMSEIKDERSAAVKTGFGLNKKFFGLWGDEQS
uniref:PDZ domain-containing protein n=1 Tax=Rhizochromulina marina TaxID=1034831 RepID=A0A7S2RXM9_9STRA|mmetsp:Transcript_22407/g.65159  ORF Transcript_22407/g.65159 Transcript_22407/m.65159 type:complete len:216 (+) Transcript_22407:98-745(+)|eukprot:CAMPEP_0118977308 /NCGR_PEP_ID=MMETSP1173-20130426/21080_1 /TAXON_ID=1034831 /ORGANISM="Rhizochromulina marina cf, Strain CCMP1243" /LENGTH=215 /DNA_ID=CAMNT_0006927397 /DNA_START=113 /DNA_END=760 /DNA_ORIENTATION=-